MLLVLSSISQAQTAPQQRNPHTCQQTTQSQNQGVVFSLLSFSLSLHFHFCTSTQLWLPSQMAIFSFLLGSSWKQVAGCLLNDRSRVLESPHGRVPPGEMPDLQWTLMQEEINFYCVRMLSCRDCLLCKLALVYLSRGNIACFHCSEYSLPHTKAHEKPCLQQLAW